MIRLALSAFAAIAILTSAMQTAVADWSATPRGSISLAVGAVTGIQELSGVTYLGPAAGGLQRFAAVQDSGNQIVLFDVSFAANGTLNSAAAVSAIALAPASDYEGIVFTGPQRNTVYISEETTPGVHEHNLTTGARLNSVGIPAVFANRRDNRGFEALARSASGDVMWTANEDALSVDGPVSTQSTGGIVRLQRIRANGDGTTTAGTQYAYRLRPIHSGGMGVASGLTDLVMLPDDTLLALERSTIVGTPTFRSTIIEIDFGGATDISAATFNGGLVGKTYTPVDKAQLWSGQIGGAAGVGANLEGLALGPPLSNNHWLLVGVVDNGGSGANAIVSFDLALSAGQLEGDYNGDDAVDEGDYALWKNTYGSTIVLAADGNGNHVVDAADYTVWRNNSGNEIANGAGDEAVSVVTAPEPASAWLVFIAAVLCGSSYRAVPVTPLWRPPQTGEQEIADRRELARQVVVELEE